MKLTFQHQLNIELLLSERRRTLILISIFSIAIIYRLVDMYLFSRYNENLQPNDLRTVWLFPITILAFELFCLLYITRRLRTNKKKVPLLMQYANTAFEIFLPSVILLYFAREYPGYNVLQSPAVFIYFIFIILSTLRLNFALSCFCGLLACSSYIFLSLFLYDHLDSTDGTRAFIILFCGIASGLVAKQIHAGINNSLREAERRQKVENIFGQQISAEVAGRMLENDGKIESRRIHAAIMFIDVRNFSAFAAGKHPEEIVKYQNEFFSIVINTVGKFNGVVHQFLGDGCMVSFGAPLSLNNPSQNAVSAAMVLLAALEKATQHGHLIQTKVGIGIHSGEVVTGNIGTMERQQYSITGGPVIIASRIEQLNKQYASQVLVSEDVIACIDNESHPAICLGQVALKGWHKPISVYQLA